MTAQSTDVARREEKWKYHLMTLAAGKIAYQGAMACLNLATGKVEPGSASSNLLFVGKFAEKVDATLADQPVNVDFIDEITLTYFANATSTDAIAATDVGKDAYILDDNTVAITRSGRSLAGRIMVVDAVRGIGIQKSGVGALSAIPSLPAYVANDAAPTDIVNGGLYDVPTTAAATTITLPAAAADGTVARFAADGTKNGHTVTYRDATGPVALTTALTASKRHLVIVAKLGGKWFANAYVSP